MTRTTAAAAPESDSDDERPVVIEMRRVGDTAWRGFAMQKDAAKAFGVSPGDVSLLVNHPTKCSGKLLQYKARRPVDSDGEEAPAVAQHRRLYGMRAPAVDSSMRPAAAARRYSFWCAQLPLRHCAIAYEKPFTSTAYSLSHVQRRVLPDWELRSG